MTFIPNSITQFSVHKFGENPDVDSAASPTATEDIYTNGGVYPFPTAMGTLSIVSTSSEDASGGTGATQIKISALDDNFDPVNLTVTLNGLTPVVTTEEVYRINRMFIVGTVGSAGTNVGTINVTHATAGIISSIPANDGQTLQAVYTVPRGYNGYVQSFSFFVEGTTSAQVGCELRRRINLGNDAGGWRAIVHGQAPNNSKFEEVINNTGLSVTEGDDLKASVTSSSANNVNVDATFDLMLFPRGNR